MAEYFYQVAYVIGLILFVYLFVAIVFGIVNSIFIFRDRREIKKKRKAFDRELREMMEKKE